MNKKTGGYQRGMAVNTSIGQGDTLATPMQLAVGYAAIVNGGTVVRPQIVQRIETADYRVVRKFGTDEGTAEQNVSDGRPPVLSDEFRVKVREQVDATPEQLRAIRKGLVAVAQEPGGTAYYRRSKLVSMGGKTEPRRWCVCVSERRPKIRTTSNGITHGLWATRLRIGRRLWLP